MAISYAKELIVTRCNNQEHNVVYEIVTVCSMQIPFFYKLWTRKQPLTLDSFGNYPLMSQDGAPQFAATGLHCVRYGVSAPTCCLTD